MCSLLLASVDLETLETFALRIGPMHADQYAGWRKTSSSQASRRLGQLVEADWLRAERCSIRELPTVSTPLLRCEPGKAEPDYGHWAHVARQRFLGSRSRLATVYYASRRCYRAFGVRRRASLKPQHVNHDLALTSCYLNWVKSEESIAKLWRHEDTYVDSVGRGRKVPDVLLVDPETDMPTEGIDFLGPSYSAQRLRDLAHELLTVRQIPLQFF